MTSDYSVGDLGVIFSSIRPGAADAIGNWRPTI